MPSQSPGLNTQVETARLWLRTYQPEDAALYLQVVQENREHLAEFLPKKVQALQNEADAEAWIRWLNGEWEQGSLFVFGLWEKTSGRCVGETYLANPDWDVPCIELGYFLVQTTTGQGYAAEAARAALGWAFETLHVSRVDLQCRADNLPSQRVAERLGFRLEGCQRLRHRKHDGALVDRLWYGLLGADWMPDLRNSSSD